MDWTTEEATRRACHSRQTPYFKFNFSVRMKLELPSRPCIGKHSQKNCVTFLRFVLDLVEVICSDHIVNYDFLLDTSPVDRILPRPKDMLLDGRKLQNLRV